MDENKILNALKFSESLVREECNNFQNILVFLKSFTRIYNIEKNKLPYHINLMDELRCSATENAHSRILGKLLQQQTVNGKFEILESFLEYLIEKDHGAFAGIRIEKPQITQEKERIDLWIKENNKYAIIIENKIHKAPDQERQIENYINTTKTCYGFTDKQIYVIYLPPTYAKEPDEQSWGRYFDSEIREKRYLNLSFKDDIIPWLKEKVLANIRMKDTYLRSAVEQYIDHLEGIFNLRTINIKMNMELQKFIKDMLGIQGINIDEDLKKVLEKKEELIKATTELQKIEDNIRETIRINWLSEWENRLKQDYPEYEMLKRTENTVGLKVPDYHLYIHLSTEENGYCQIENINYRDQKAKILLPDELKNRIENVLNNKGNSEQQIWKYLSSNYQEGYPLLQEVMNLIQNYLKDDLSD